MSLHGSCSEADGGVEAEEMPDEGGCDELGSRLEEELNRSIEKMREEEVAAVKSPVSTQPDIPVARLISLSDSLSSGGSPSGSTSPQSGDGFPHSSLELLQDVEMPTCNISSCDSTKQSISPTKNDSLEAGQQAVTESSTQGCLDTAVLVVTSSPTSDDNLNDSVFIKENTHSPLSFSELLQDIEMPNFNLSSNEYSRLLSLPSNSPASMTHTGSHHHHAPADSSGELRATPAAPPGNTATLRDQLAAAEDKIKPRMLTLSPIKKMDLKEILLSRDNPGELDLSKLGSDTLSSSGVLGEAVVVLTELERQAANLTLSPQPSDRRFTVHPLDMEGINDSLLNSFQSSPQKPRPESSQDCPLPPVSKAEGTGEPQGHRTAKENTIDRLTKLLGITTDQDTSTGDKGTTANPPQTEKNNCTFTPAETCANQTFNALSHPLKEGNPAINTTFDSKAPTKTADPSANTTFDSKAPVKTADPSANTTFDLNKQAAGSGNPTANTTFDLNQAVGKAHPSVNVTFDGKTQPAGKGNTAANTTFDLNNAAKGKTNSDANSTFDCNKPATNATFDKNTAAKSEERPATTANTTFDFNKNQEGNGATNSTFSTQPESDKGELNVTFEKGEYRIGSQNETVNLMDAEENILQVILDATPKKISKQPPKASSTPKTTGNPQQPHLKAGLMKASTTNFLNRLLEGAKKEGQQESAPPTTTTATTTTSAITGMKLLDGAMLGGQQQQQQQRRQLKGRPGPMKALPLSMVVTNAAHLEAAAGGDSSGGTNGNGRETLCQRRKVTVPSFGSLSSIESEMPSTPDCGINCNLSISSPEAFRMDILPCAPCITSTPTFTGRGVFTMMEMDGAIPTPISQVSSKPHFSRLVSSSSQPEGMSSGSVDKEQTHRRSSSDEAKPKSPPDQPQPSPVDTAPVPTAVTPPVPAQADIAPQPPCPTPARPVEVDSTGGKETEECVEQQKPSTCSDVTQTVPPSPQAHPLPPPSSPVPPPPPPEVKQGTSPLQPSSLVPPAPGTTQTVSPQPPLEIAQPSLSPSSQPSAVAKEPSLPLPPSHTTMTGPSQAPPPLPTTSSSSSSSSSLSLSQPSPPPPPETKQPETSSLSPPRPPPTTTTATAPSKKSTTITKPQRKPLVSPSHTVKSRQSASVSPPSRITRPQKKILASPLSTKSQSAPAPAARRDGNLKRPSTLVKPAMPKVRQVQPPNMSDKENRRRSSLSDITRQGPPQPAPPTKVERQSPLLSKRNPAPRLVLKPCNTNTKPVTSNPKVPSHVPALKGIPLKSNPQVETVGVASGKNKSNLRKSSPQPRSGLPRSSSGSKLPKTLNTSDSNLPSLKISSSYPNKPQGASQAPPSVPQARKSGLNLSGTSAPASTSIPPAKTSSAPQIKPNLTVRSSLALRQKPSLLKTPKPLL
ncbi:nascent polypeptide-associated complex subunit alpha, muscle-specific form-like isoform X2 [Portunus trituberculatus]|uniref:nascent polypeptide-associated complex subunit alpha, muscle-specific form-like isoform X2 n=1 Tax=Portunus trituberculatus TaxID=210409 RepID=UPI001E1CD5E8|nr:nascent polypeptide-associated complex subunit alpha, muscle-specific form-like isoform X2 [Portunus trituberculatus]XP_045111998.1 nascent polypeptide-associated complex subunit alpha, muscle-specific form-like isoform X2 [Portunus trituberculatus]